jgi:hypothetical protein
MVRYDKAEEEYNKIKLYILEEFGKYKGNRYKDSEAGALLTGAKKRIHSKITRAIEKIGTVNSDLYLHFSESLKPLGSNVSYHPPQHIDWDLQSTE